MLGPPSKEQKMKELGIAIVRERKRHGISQKELAKRVGISANALCSIERGASRPSDAVLQRICACLGVKPVVFFVDVTIDLSGAINALQSFTNSMKAVQIGNGSEGL